MAVNTRNDKVRKTIEFRSDNWDWLEQQYKGSSWWILNQLLEEFKQAVGEQLPSHYARIGARELANKLNIDTVDDDDSTASK